MMTKEQKQALIERLNKLAEGLKWHNVAYAQDVLSALAALTQPASPAFKLPDEKERYPITEDVEAWKIAHNLEASGFNECIAEVKRLNAPHTAQIEPICATGGAEWLSDERVEEIIYRAEMFGHGAGYLPDEVIPMAKELLALRKAIIPEEFLNAIQNSNGMFELSEDCMCQLLNMLCSKPTDSTT